MPRCALRFDDHPILEAEGLVWTLAERSNDAIALERATFDYLVPISSPLAHLIAHWSLVELSKNPFEMTSNWGNRLNLH